MTTSLKTPKFHVELFQIVGLLLSKIQEVQQPVITNCQQSFIGKHFHRHFIGNIMDAKR